MTCLTLTGWWFADLGVRGIAQCLLPSTYADQSAGENGERATLLFGESVAGEYRGRGDCGIRNRRRPVGVRADNAADGGGRTKGEGGTMDAEEALRA